MSDLVVVVGPDVSWLQKEASVYSSLLEPSLALRSPSPCAVPHLVSLVPCTAQSLGSPSPCTPFPFHRAVLVRACRALRGCHGRDARGPRPSAASHPAYPAPACNEPKCGGSCGRRRRKDGGEHGLQSPLEFCVITMCICTGKGEPRACFIATGHWPRLFNMLDRSKQQAELAARQLAPKPLSSPLQPSRATDDDDGLWQPLDATGISAFAFQGTNAHAVMLASPPAMHSADHSLTQLQGTLPAATDKKADRQTVRKTQLVWARKHYWSPSAPHSTLLHRFLPAQPTSAAARSGFQSLLIKEGLFIGCASHNTQWLREADKLSSNGSYIEN
eukprot:1133716-Pelagomonas_calceolata.AAC.2